MMAAKSFLPLSAVAALLGTLITPTFAFRAAPSIGIKKHAGSSIPLDLNSRQAQHYHRRPATATTTLNISTPDEIPNNNEQEQEIMDAVLREQQIRQVQQEAEQMPPSQKRGDPLIASLTRNDESPLADTRPVPLFGEIPVDGTLLILVPAAVISILGVIFSIVIALNSGDSFVQELSEVDLPETKSTPTVVVEGQCRGLCSSQDEDLDGLRNFMESISRKD